MSNSPALILCSSGTTGLPKGVCKSHAQWIHQIFPMWKINSTGQQVIFNFSTLYCSTGMIFLVTGTLYGLKRVITKRTFDADWMVEILERFKVTTCLTPPYALALLLNKKDFKPFNHLEIFMPSGSIVSKNLCEAIQPYLPNGSICPVYGASEGDFLAVSFDAQRYGSVGKPSPNTRMKIIDDDGNNLGPNQQGEICFQTKVCFLGYFDEPEKTKDAIQDGWVYSGDIGYFDEDGFLFIVDRKKDMLKFNNFQVNLF